MQYFHEIHLKVAKSRKLFSILCNLYKNEKLEGQLFWSFLWRWDQIETTTLQSPLQAKIFERISKLQ